MQTGGGGSGGNYGANDTVGRGGWGGPFCGGASSGSCWSNGGSTVLPAGDYGGPGSNGYGEPAASGAPGGNGDPVGSSWGSVIYPPSGPGGGILFLFTRSCYIATGCSIQANGADGGMQDTDSVGSGAAGGGIAVIATLGGGLSNLGSLIANGGAGLGNVSGKGGAGGAGYAQALTVS